MTKNNKKGFTIIEVVLVLAIAGLIFLMVFIALPALQRSQRNTRRRQDMARINSALVDYIANNPSDYKVHWGGTYQTGDSVKYTGVEGDGDDGNHLKKFVIKYVDSSCSSDGTTSTWNPNNCSDQFRDPDGTPYTLRYAEDLSDNSSDVFDIEETIPKYYREHKIFFIAGAMCGSNEKEIKKAGGKNQFVLIYLLEGGSFYCSDNQ